MNTVKLLAPLALFAIASTAHANIIVSSNGSQLVSDVAGAQTFDFGADANGCGGYASCYGDFAFLQEGNPSLYAKPAGLADDDWFLTVPYDNSGGTATFSLGFSADYFGLLWGSIDSYNTITFLSDGNTVGTFSGGDSPIEPADGNQAASFFVEFWFEDGLSFDAIEFDSTQRAFETANHAVRAVPAPGALALLGASLLGLALVRRRLG